MGANTDFGGYLVERGLLADAAWARVQDVLQEARQGLAATLTGLGLLSEKDLAAALGKHYCLPHAEPQDWPLEPLSIADINPTFLSHYHILPTTDAGDTIEAILGDPTNDYAVKALSFATGKPVRPKIATLREVETAINRLYFGDAGPSDELSEVEDLANDVDRLKELAADAPVIRFVDRMIDDALSKRASDIHVEPIDGRLQIRFRVDGILIEMNGPSRDMTAAVISRLKIMSGLDIAERRLPQDGRMRVRAHGKEIDFRVSTAPTAQGEAVVLRLLDRGAVVLNFDALGFDDIVKKPFRSALRQPDGIVLVTGPTGSGKTTTLYTGLSELNQPENKILTVEDPVEYVIEGLGQVQVDNRIGRTFAGTLRTFLRQDPDIIMVGEIRDEETAGIAIQASLTGHLVLSTLHTNSAAAAIARLVDMGVEDYLLASTLRVVMAQRLVRTLCENCKEQHTPEPELLQDLGLDSEAGPFFAAKGCDACHGSGYLGRTMIAEILVIDRAMEKAIIERKTGAELEDLARQNGMRTLFEHGIQKVSEGNTSLTEVLRVTRERN
ncbi:GspE/PulE family protein [Kordiimonas marina]|uniref:GspE/PulE family protein n=1 Tax=Kordiimonas marina TaxID=2872312 RepID=UPI001FF2782B|nr:ATPase, T2SS/T4P/T4SS family [Kordiimonas marina]MCJ9430042.1 Flp pilus assembly complex ATPase component TadA [Kordiimonas marina]